MIVEFTVPCVPAGQPRSRSSVFAGRSRVYNPTTIGKGDRKRPHPAVEFKASLRHAASAAYSGRPLHGPTRVDVEAVFPRPKSLIWKRKPMPRLLHTAKPDRDNLDKCVLDALTQAGVIRDDAQVCGGEIWKWVASGDEQPHVVVRVSVLNLDAAY